jgi:ribosomal protein L37E
MAGKSEKLRRMEVRRNMGNRVIKDPPPTRRGPEYLVAHASFECRRCFKKAQSIIKPRCPGCSVPLREMGRSFKAPKAIDIEQWSKIQRLWEAGFRFVGCGSHGGPALPKRLKEVDEFIAKNPRHPLRLP